MKYFVKADFTWGGYIVYRKDAEHGNVEIEHFETKAEAVEHARLLNLSAEAGI